MVPKPIFVFGDVRTCVEGIVGRINRGCHKVYQRMVVGYCEIPHCLRGSDNSDFTSLETLKFKNPSFQHISMYYLGVNQLNSWVTIWGWTLHMYGY